MLTVPSHLEIDILRPNGTTETVVHPQWKSMSDKTFAQIKAQTKAAGRGDVLAYRNITKQVAEPADYAAARASELAYNTSRAAIYRAMDAKTN